MFFGEPVSPADDLVLWSCYLLLLRLLGNSAEPNVKNIHETMPLHLAARRGFEDAVRLCPDQEKALCYSLSCFPKVLFGFTRLLR